MPRHPQASRVCGQSSKVDMRNALVKRETMVDGICGVTKRREVDRSRLGILRSVST